MILTQEYSRVAAEYFGVELSDWPDSRAWLVSPEGKIYSCGFLHETCFATNRDLQKIVGEGENIHDLIRDGWGKVGAFNDTAYLQVMFLQDRVLRAFQSILKSLETEPESVQIISSGDTSVIPYKDFRWFDSVADMKKFARSGRFAAVKPTRAWMVSPKGKVHDCGKNHENYIREHAEEFGGVDNLWDLCDNGWTRIGVLDKELYFNIPQRLTASTLNFLQNFAMRVVQVPYDKVEVYVNGVGSVLFTKSGFSVASLKAINRRGPDTYSSRQAALPDSRDHLKNVSLEELSYPLRKAFLLLDLENEYQKMSLNQISSKLRRHETLLEDETGWTADELIRDINQLLE